MDYIIEDIKPGNLTSSLLLSSFPKILYNGFINIKFPTKTYKLTKGFEYYRKEIENFEIFDDDIWVISHPKTGSTWAQEMIWCIDKGLGEENQHIFFRAPHFEYTTLFRRSLTLLHPSLRYNSFKLSANLPRRRHIKTHLPYELLPNGLRNGKGKIIYITRNPNDVCVSYHHHCQLTSGYTGTLSEFVTLFSNGELPYGPFWDSVMEYWQHRNDSNVLIITYEEMKQDLRKVIQEVSRFLGRKISGEDVEDLVHHLSFEQLKQNKSVNLDEIIRQRGLFAGNGSFMRQGKVGASKQFLDEHMLFQLGKMTRDAMKKPDFDPKILTRLKN